MATTTNYSWTTPDDTGLVKDGASAIRSLGSAIDTSVKALNPGTTAGDIDYYSSATAKTRLAKGTAGQVLTMNSGATAPEWATISAGGKTLLSTTTLSGTSVTINSISQSYKDLVIEIYGVTGSANADFSMKFNTSESPWYHSAFGISSSLSGGNGFNAQGYFQSDTLSVYANTTGGANYWVLTIPNYASAIPHTGFGAMAVYGSNSINYAGTLDINHTNASAISNIVIARSAGNFNAGTVKIYGVN